MRLPRHPATTCLGLLLAIVLAGCGGAATATDLPTDSPTGSPAATASAGASEPPVVTLPPVETPPPSDPPSETPSSDPSGAPGSPGAGLADACTGTDANRDFYEAVAVAVQWPVYCPVLPGGWFVDAGEYRLASRGRLEITYRGPGGAMLELRQGAFCATAGGCLPAGTDLGEAAYGDLTGTLISADDGTWAIGVDAGAEISWLAVGAGMDEATFRSFADDLTLVSD